MAEDGPQTKLEEQASAKGDLSYTYFHRGTSNATTAPAPRMLSTEEAHAQQALEAERKQQGSSTWNHAGTFEEKCVTPWAKDRVKEMLKGLPGKDGLVVTDVTAVTGDANIFMVRGKRRHGFSLEVSLAWTCGDVTGTTQCTGVDSDDLDDMVLTAQVTNSNASRAAAEGAALASARSMNGPITEAMESFLEELKQK